MTCPKCHIVIDADSRFCKHCGAVLNAPGGPAATTPGPSVPAGPKVVPGGGAAATDPFTAAATAVKAGDAHRDPAMEKEVWQGRPAWRAYYGTWALWLIASIVALVPGYKYLAPESVWRTVLWLVIAGAAVAIFVREALVILGIHYRLTTQRLFINKGILTRTTDQLELVRVEDVRLRQGIIDRIVGTGDVEIVSSDQTDNKLMLMSIASPDDVAEHVRRNVRGARGKGSLFVENV